MISNFFVVVMGLGTVFVGLICIVFLILIMGRVVALIEKLKPKKAKALASESCDDSELVAVITAALAQDLGTEPKNIIIRSITDSK